MKRFHPKVPEDRCPSNGVVDVEDGEGLLPEELLSKRLFCSTHSSQVEVYIEPYPVCAYGASPTLLLLLAGKTTLVT